jgi:hypothetical protein
MRPIIFVAVLAAFSPVPLYAQAWLPSAGEGAVAVVFQDMVVKRHLYSDGSPIEVGEIDSHNMMLDLTYGVTDKVALNVSVPYVSARYTGRNAHPGSVLDDGAFHGTMQDFRINVRYGLKTGGTAIAPFADLIVPSHDYEYYGHAAPGRRLTELQLGLNIGHVVARGLPGLFMQGRYSYGFTQRSLGQYHDRSNLDAELGYFVHPRLRVLALTATQYTHGGVPFTHAFPGDLCGLEKPTAAQLLSCPLFTHHDRLAQANFIDVGFGTQVTLTRRLDVLASVTTTAVGRSVHALDHGISISVSWGLGKRGPAAPEGDSELTQSLPKCLCEKGAKAP